MSAPGTDVVAVTMFALRPGVRWYEFQRFSLELDQPACRSCNEVVSFEVYHVSTAPDGGAADVVEVLRVHDWAAWESVRDNDPSFTPVLQRFTELVDLDTLRTWFTRAV